MQSVSLETERLLLRPFRENDWQAVSEYASDPEVVRYFRWGPLTDEKDVKEFVQGKINPKQTELKSHWFAIVLKAHDKLIGECLIIDFSPKDRNAFIAYSLNRKYWGQGYTTEAANAVLRFGFSRLDYHKISATCAVDNVASSRVLEKIGMKREGYLREEQWVKGEWLDMLLYTILDHEWKQLGTKDTA